MTTKPTQAQIEAAAKEIRVMLATVGSPTAENFAYAALTAASSALRDEVVGIGRKDYPAAEVDDNDDIDRLHAENMALRIKLNALTETNATIDTGIRIATIERCAQVIEALDGTVIGPHYRKAAAAIRKLRDEDDYGVS